MGTQLAPLKDRALAPIKRAGDALAAIRTGLRGLVRAHLGPGRVRMMPIYDRSEHEWIDEHGQHHRQIEQDWIGLAWFRDGQLVHEIRWGRRGGMPALSQDDDPRKLP
jgi:hypothetical protein